nr:hypothetical protein [Mycobacterium lepromatosis]
MGVRPDFVAIRFFE